MQIQTTPATVGAAAEGSPTPPLLPGVKHRGDRISPTPRYKANDRRHYRQTIHLSLMDRTGEGLLEWTSETEFLRHLPDLRSGMKPA